MRGTDGERTCQNHRAGSRSATHRLGGDRLGRRASAVGGARGGGPARGCALFRTPAVPVRGPGDHLRRPRLRGGGGGRGVRQCEPVLDAKAGPCAGGGDAGPRQAGPGGGGIFAESDQEGRGRGGPCRQEPDRLYDQAAVADGGGRQGRRRRRPGRGGHPCATEETVLAGRHAPGGGVIGRLRGVLAEVGESDCLIDCAGVGYVVSCGARPRGRLPAPGDEATIHVHSQWSEDAGPRLYGFLTRDERRAFTTLLAIQGVGPKAALAVLDVLPPGELAGAVAREDKAAVARANGVGPKLALRIVTELKGKPLGDVSFAPTAPGVHVA